MNGQNGNHLVSIDRVMEAQKAIFDALKDSGFSDIEKRMACEMSAKGFELKLTMESTMMALTKALNR